MGVYSGWAPVYVGMWVGGCGVGGVGGGCGDGDFLFRIWQIWSKSCPDLNQEIKKKEVDPKFRFFQVGGKCQFSQNVSFMYRFAQNNT